MSRGDSQAGRKHIPSHLQELVKTWKQLSWNWKNPKSSGRRAREWLSGADRHLSHITNSQRKVRYSVLHGPPSVANVTQILAMMPDIGQQ